jgi:hypothetical protein
LITPPEDPTVVPATDVSGQFAGASDIARSTARVTPKLLRAMGVLLLPHIESGFADAELATDVRYRCPRLDLAEGVGDLFLGKLDRFIGPVLSWWTAEAATLL